MATDIGCLSFVGDLNFLSLSDKFSLFTRLRCQFCFLNQLLYLCKFNHDVSQGKNKWIIRLFIFYALFLCCLFG